MSAAAIRLQPTETEYMVPIDAALTGFSQMAVESDTAATSNRAVETQNTIGASAQAQLALGRRASGRVQTSQRERHRRYSSYRNKHPSHTVAGWIWLKLCSHVRKATVEFFDAVDAGRVDAVRAMVKGSPVLLLRTRPGTRWTAVHYVAERGEYGTLTALLEEARALDGSSSAVTMSCAGKAKRVEFVQRMVDALTEKNLTPLMLACKRGHPSTATYLMAMGSNPTIADREGAKMAIHYACLYGHWACTQVMMDRRWVVPTADGLQPLAHSVITDMHGSSRYIDARTCAGLTPLHMAAWAGHAEVAKILLANGAALNPRIVFSSPSTSSVLPGSTPTHLATRKNRIHVVKALLTAYLERKRAAESHGQTLMEEDPRSIADDRGNYAIMHAIARGNNNMAVLLDANADLEQTLATDLNQLGQVPKLQALAMSALRARLVAELDGLIAKSKALHLESKEKGAYDTLSQRSVILDGSPKSAHPGELLRCLDVQLNGVPANPTTSMLDDMRGVDMQGCTHQLEDLQCSLKSRELACSERSDDEIMCGICMEQPQCIQLRECQHTLCQRCARQLLMIAAPSSCQCPFCRTFIAGFNGLPSCTEVHSEVE